MLLCDAEAIFGKTIGVIIRLPAPIDHVTELITLPDRKLQRARHTPSRS